MPVLQSEVSVGWGWEVGLEIKKKPREFFAIVLEYEEIPQIQHTLIFPFFLACSKPENFVIIIWLSSAHLIYTDKTNVFPINTFQVEK